MLLELGRFPRSITGRASNAHFLLRQSINQILDSDLALVPVLVTHLVRLTYPHSNSQADSETSPMPWKAKTVECRAMSTQASAVDGFTRDPRIHHTLKLGEYCDAAVASVAYVPPNQSRSCRRTKRLSSIYRLRRDGHGLHTCCSSPSSAIGYPTTGMPTFSCKFRHTTLFPGLACHCLPTDFNK